MRRLIKTPYQVLTSRSLAIGLMVALAVLMVVANLIPQQGRSSPELYALWQREAPNLSRGLTWLGLDHLYDSWWFMALLTFLALSIVACTTRRLYHALFHQPPPGKRVVERGLAPSVIFHLSLILILMGGALSVRTRVNATALITEGETYQGSFQTVSNRDYLRFGEQPAFFFWRPGLEVFLKQLYVEYQPGSADLKDCWADIELRENGKAVASKRVRVNQPLIYDDTSFVLEGYGYSPYFTITDPRGSVIHSYYEKLRTAGTPASDSAGTGDGFEEFRVPWSDITVRARLFPGADGSKRPAFQMEIFDGLGKKHYAGWVYKDKPLHLDNLSLFFTDLKYWVLLRVIRDEGARWAYIGFLTAALGLGWRLIPLLLGTQKEEASAQ